MAKRVTVQDVARAAGVSIATVSLGLRGLGKMSDDTRARVHAVAQELGYHANPNAAALRSGRSTIIAAVMSPHTDVQRARAFETLWAAALNAFAAEAADHGYATLIIPPKNLHLLNSVHVEMLFVLDMLEDQQLTAVLATKGLPMAGGGAGDDRFAVTFRGDQEAVHVAAMQWLVEQGCRKPVFLAPENPRVAGKAHMAAHEQWLERTGVDAPMMQIAVDPAGVVAGVARAIEAGADGVFSMVGSAAGLAAAVERAGRRAGEEVKVVAFEDPLGNPSPGIAIVGYGAAEAGAAAARACVEFLKSADRAPVTVDRPFQLRSV